jgi:hypothetical protein
MKPTFGKKPVAFTLEVLAFRYSDLAYYELKNPGRDMVIAGADMNAAGWGVKKTGREEKPPNGTKAPTGGE